MNENLLSDQELEQVSAGVGKKVDQYAVQVDHAYWIYFPMQDGPFIINPYGSRSGNSYRIMVYKVYEAPGAFWGTDRTIDGIDMDTGEYVTVVVNEGNVWELE